MSLSENPYRAPAAITVGAKPSLHNPARTRRRAGVICMLLGGAAVGAAFAAEPVADNLLVSLPVYAACGGEVDCFFDLAKPLLPLSVALHLATYFGIGYGTAVIAQRLRGTHRAAPADIGEGGAARPRAISDEREKNESDAAMIDSARRSTTPSP